MLKFVSGLVGRGLLPRSLAVSSTQRRRYGAEVAQAEMVDEVKDERANREPLATRLSTPEVIFSKGAIWRDYYKELPSLTGTRSNFSLNKVLNLLKLCKSPMLMELPSVKVKLAEDIWKQLREAGVPAESHIYNILLSVYNKNEHSFVPSEFLEEMKANNVYPNLGTFTLLIETYCLQGNVGGATKLLEYMKTVDMPISESVYASLVTGHARAGNMEAAKEVITKMKSKQHTPHNIVYNSLACAYAEKGDIDNVIKLLAEMRNQRLFPSVFVYIQIMRTLSKCGHGALVSQVLDCLKNKEWVSSDLRMLVIDCLSRGEIIAPRIFIDQLIEHHGLTREVLCMYIVTAVQQGKPFLQVVQELGEAVDFTSFPEVYSMIATKLVFIPPPQVVGAKNGNSPPKPGDLAPHPLGEQWGENLLELYKLMCSESKDEIQPCYYYPLLARHISDNNLDGFMATWKQMLKNGIPMTNISKQYVGEMLSVSGISLNEYVKTKLGECEEGSSELLDVALFGFLVHLCQGEYVAAAQMVDYFEKSDLLLEYSEAISRAIASGQWLSGLAPELMHVLKRLQKLPDGPNMTAILTQCCFSHTNANKPLFDLLQFLKSLEEIRVQISPKVYLVILQNLTFAQKDLFYLVNKKLLSEDGELETSDYVALFKGAVRLRKYSLAQKLYHRLPPSVLEEADIRDSYLICLSRASMSDALKLLNSMLAEGQKPNYFAWESLILAAMDMDAPNTAYLIEQMLSCGYHPSTFLRQRLLKYYVQKKKLEGATAEFEILESEGGTTAATYYLMAKLWVEQGQEESIRKYMRKSKEIEEQLAPFLIKAKLKKGCYEEALALLEEVDLTLSSSSLYGFVFRAFHRAGHSLDPLIVAMEKSPLSPSFVKSILFFSFVDVNEEARAISILKEVDHIDPQMFQFRMETPNASKYLKILKENDYHLRDMKSAYLMKSGYAMTKDSEGNKELRESLEKNNRTDWLWTVV